MSNQSQISPSPESDILRQIEELIAKLAAGNVTPQEMQLLQDLQKARVDHLRPKHAFDPEDAFASVAAFSRP